MSTPNPPITRRLKKRGHPLQFDFLFRLCQDEGLIPEGAGRMVYRIFYERGFGPWAARRAK